jgi:hypothetical protein
MKKTALVFFLVLTGLVSLQSCYKCRQCNLVLSDEQENWIPYSEGKTLLFTSEDTASRYFVIGKREYYADREICGTDRPCSVELAYNIYETGFEDSIRRYRGDVYIFAFDDATFTGVFNFRSQQLYQPGSGSSLQTGTGGGILFHDSLEVNSVWYHDVYEASFDTIPADTANCVQMLYSVSKGLLRFSEQNGHSWSLNEIR